MNVYKLNDALAIKQKERRKDILRILDHDPLQTDYYFVNFLKNNNKIRVNKVTNHFSGHTSLYVQR